MFNTLRWIYPITDKRNKCWNCQKRKDRNTAISGKIMQVGGEGQRGIINLRDFLAL